MNEKHILLNIAVVLFFVMFIYSGIMKIKNFDKKSTTLAKKIHSSKTISNIGIALAIGLEIIGSLYIIIYIMSNNKQNNIFYKITLFCLALFVIFMITVTMLYHPPTSKIIPFLSNVTTFAGFLLIVYAIIQ